MYINFNDSHVDTIYYLYWKSAQNLFAFSNFYVKFTGLHL